MIFHGVDFLIVVVELGGFSMLGLAAGVVFCRFMGPLRGVLFRVFFSTLHSSEESPGPCKKHVFFITVGAFLIWPAFLSCGCQRGPSRGW